jgi:hypothetical protein
MPVRFEMFKSHLQSWETMFSEAAAFASGLGPERLISISHSEDQGKGVVTVWYWSEIRMRSEPHSTGAELDEMVEDSFREQ